MLLTCRIEQTDANGNVKGQQAQDDGEEQCDPARRGFQCLPPRETSPPSLLDRLIRRLEFCSKATMALTMHWASDTLCGLLSLLSQPQQHVLSTTNPRQRQGRHSTCTLRVCIPAQRCVSARRYHPTSQYQSGSMTGKGKHTNVSTTVASRWTPKSELAPRRYVGIAIRLVLMVTSIVGVNSVSLCSG